MLGYTAAEVMNKVTPADISDPQEIIARAATLSLELGTLITPGFEALVFKASRGIETDTDSVCCSGAGCISIEAEIFLAFASDKGGAALLCKMDSEPLKGHARFFVDHRVQCSPNLTLNR
jgi:hypothetical protein